MNEIKYNGKLEDHIDAPIKKCVGALNFLGFRTGFSCCGFHYCGELVKKDHIINYPQIFIDLNGLTSELVLLLFDIARKADFVLCFRPNEHSVVLGRHITFSMWNKPDSPHQHEMPNVVIKILEDVLFSYEDKFKESIYVVDNNEEYAEKYPYWNYKPAEPWNIGKKYFLNE